jgi:hypothetical protein
LLSLPVSPCFFLSRRFAPSYPEIIEMLPTDSKARKEIPLYAGCIAYFPDALAAVAAVSKKGNDKHNPGQPLHWSREKSSDHQDCIVRHLFDAGKDGTRVDENGDLHAAALAWRALALLQLACEAKAAATSKPTLAEPNPWREWTPVVTNKHLVGEHAPVGPRVSVEYKMRNGCTDTMYAGNLRWTSKDVTSDIIAWRPADYESKWILRLARPGRDVYVTETVYTRAEATRMFNDLVIARAHD